MACVTLTFMGRAEVTGPSSRNVLKPTFKCTIIMHILQICPASFSQALAATKAVVKIKKSAGSWLELVTEPAGPGAYKGLAVLNIFSFLNLGAI